VGVGGVPVKVNVGENVGVNVWVGENVGESVWVGEEVGVGVMDGVTVILGVNVMEGVKVMVGVSVGVSEFTACIAGFFNGAACTVLPTTAPNKPPSRRMYATTRRLKFFLRNITGMKALRL
jgi:hypothetical protein